MAKTLLKTLVFTIFVPGSVTVLLPDLILPSGARPSLLPGLAGLLPVTLGAAMLLLCFWDFAAKGGGTPAPVDAPPRLVTERVYQHVRNPMYVGVLLVLAGETIGFRSGRLVIYLAAVWTGCHLFVVFYEEPTLRQKFGDSYAEYCRRVPRWIPAWRSRKVAGD